SDEPQPPKVFVAVAADLAVRSRRFRQQAAALIIADGFHTDSSGLRKPADRVRIFRLIPYHGTDVISHSSTVGHKENRSWKRPRRTRPPAPAAAPRAAAAAIRAPARTAVANPARAATHDELRPFIYYRCSICSVLFWVERTFNRSCREMIPITFRSSGLTTATRPIPDSTIMSATSPHCVSGYANPMDASDSASASRPAPCPATRHSSASCLETSP